jgi:glycogen debranching enzyme
MAAVGWVRRTATAALATCACAGIAAGAAANASAAGVPGAPASAPGGTAAGGVPQANATPTISASTKLSKRRFVAAGTRAYVVGVEDGSFPPIGWHITGQMGGFWTPPVKALDGLWFQLGSAWLDHAKRFTSGPGFVRITFPQTDGMRPTLTEFSPDGRPVVLVGLTLVPVNGKPQTVNLLAQAHSQVMAAYPWSTTTPTADQVENPDTASVLGNGVQFQQQETSDYAELGSTVTPSQVTTGSGDWGPTTAADQTVFGAKGAGGQFSWNLQVPARGRTLWVGVSGSQLGDAPALSALREGLADPGRLLAAKVSERDGVAGQSSFQVPDASVNQALLWSKLNLADLHRTVKDLQIRDVDAGTAYPPPIKTVQSLSGIDAAYPDYAEFFGTDGAYSTYGLAVAGQYKTAIQQLNAIRTVSRIVNGKTGKVVHEINSTGAMYYGDNSQPGDINETAQFAIAAGLVWQWSGNRSVLKDNYGFIKDGEHYLASLDPSPSDLWPAGNGIQEDSSLGQQVIDVASESIQALGALHDMAVAMHDPATATWAANRQSAMLAAFGQWWIPSQNLFADSLCDGPNGGTCTQAGQQLQQRYWISVSPMEQDVAPADEANAALTTMEGPTFTGSCGLYVDGVGGPEGTGGQTCYLVNTGALAVAEGNYGRMSQATTDMDKVAGQLTVGMPGALPELAQSSQYNPYESFTSRANVMQAWSSYGLLWTTAHDILGVVPDAPDHSLTVVPDLPSSWPTASVQHLDVGSDQLALQAGQGNGSFTTQVSGASGLALTIGAVIPSGSTVSSVTLNGQPAQYRTVTTHRGVEVVVTDPDSSGASQSLVVQTSS